jgi:hypothetical protein
MGSDIRKIPLFFVRARDIQSEHPTLFLSVNIDFLKACPNSCPYLSVSRTFV